MKSRRRALLVDATVAAIFGAAVVSGLSFGHNAGVWFPTYFKIDERSQNYGFHAEVPEGNGLRNRIEDGAREWNALDTTLKFHRGGVNVTWGYGSSCQGAGKNSIHWRNIPSLGVATRCVHATAPERIAEFRIAFDETRNWHGGTGAPGSNEFDIWSVSAHEFGHAGGFGSGGEPNLHWDAQGALCPNPPNNHTMCPTTTIGTRSQRSLEMHDRHTFRDRY